MTSGPASPQDPEQLKAEIERTRERLGRTAEALVAKTDVKAMAQAKVTNLTQRAKQAASQVRQQEAVSRGLNGAKRYRVPVVIAAGLLVTGVAVLVRTRSRR